MSGGGLRVAGAALIPWSPRGKFAAGSLHAGWTPHRTVCGHPGLSCDACDHGLPPRPPPAPWVCAHRPEPWKQRLRWYPPPRQDAHPANTHWPGGAAPQGGRGRWLSVTASGHLHRSLLLEPKRKASQPELQSPGPSPPYPCLAQPPPTTTNDFLIVQDPFAFLCSCPPPQGARCPSLPRPQSPR